MLCLCRATKGDGEDAAVSQVIQYEPAHRDAVNCVTNLTSDLCVSGGGDMVSKLTRFSAYVLPSDNIVQETDC